MNRLVIVTLAGIAMGIGCGSEQPEPSTETAAAENRDAEAATEEPLAERGAGREPTVDEVLREVIACLETRGRDEMVNCAAAERRLNKERLAELHQRYERAGEEMSAKHETRREDMTQEDLEEFVIEFHRSALPSR